MISIFTKDSLRKSIENLSDGAMTVLYDKYGIPSIMYVIPRTTLGQLAVSLSQDGLVTNPVLNHLSCHKDEVHPAFQFRLPQDGNSIDARIPSEIFVGAFQSTEVEVAGGKKVLASFPGKPAIARFFDHKNMCYEKNNYPDKFDSYDTWKNESPEAGWHLLNTFEAGLLLMLQYKVRSSFEITNGSGYKVKYHYENDTTKYNNYSLEKMSSSETVVVLVHALKSNEVDLNRVKRGAELSRAGSKAGRGTVLFASALSRNANKLAYFTVFFNSGNTDWYDATSLPSRTKTGYAIVLDRWVGEPLQEGDVLNVTDEYEETGDAFTSSVEVEKVLYMKTESQTITDSLKPFDPLLDMLNNSEKTRAVLRGIYNLFGLNHPIFDFTVTTPSYRYYSYLYNNFGLLDLVNTEFIHTQLCTKEIVDGCFLASLASQPVYLLDQELCLIAGNYVDYPLKRYLTTTGVNCEYGYLICETVKDIFENDNSSLGQYVSNKGLYLFQKPFSSSSTAADHYLCFADSSVAASDLYSVQTTFSSRVPLFVVFQESPNSDFIKLVKHLALSAIIGLVTTDTTRVWQPVSNNYHSSSLMWPDLGINEMFYTPIEIDYTNIRKRNVNQVCSISRLVYYISSNNPTFYTRLHILSRGSGRCFMYDTTASNVLINKLEVHVRPSFTGFTDSNRRDFLQAFSNPEHHVASPWHISFDDPNAGYTSRLVYVNTKTQI